MSAIGPSRCQGFVSCLAAALAVLSLEALAADAPVVKQESPLVKMLKSGKLPASRQGAIVDMIGKRGTTDDLGFLFEKVIAPDASATLRARGLDALTEAALTRKSRPSGDLARLSTRIDGKGEPADRLAAVKLAGLWKVEKLGPMLGKVAASADVSAALHAEALDALAAIGGRENRDRIDALTKPGRPVFERSQAVAALTRLDLDAASARAGEVLGDAKGNDDLGPLVAAFLNRQGGADRLANVVAGGLISLDAAKLALREVYAFGRGDQALVASLTKAARLDAEVKPLDPASMEKMLADVASKGDAARGENLFRRADLNCAKCHALSGAGGGVGPELSAVGGSSPVDYLVNSIMLPDQAIKEEFRSIVVLTTDGQVYQGIVADKDDKRIVLREAAGTLRTIPASDVEETKEGGSLMPKGLVNFLTRNEFIDLVRFLSELGKPGAFAVRSTPTVQRWRFLKPVPPKSAAAEAVKTEASHWFPAYARTAGDLPLGEIAALAGSKVLFLQAEIAVSHAGKVAFLFHSPDGLTAWLDEKPAPAPSLAGNAFEAELTEGTHRLTIRVDTLKRKAEGLRVVVAKPAGSRAEYAVVGGK